MSSKKNQLLIHKVQFPFFGQFCPHSSALPPQRGGGVEDTQKKEKKKKREEKWVFMANFWCGFEKQKRCTWHCLLCLHLLRSLSCWASLSRSLVSVLGVELAVVDKRGAIPCALFSQCVKSFAPPIEHRVNGLHRLLCKHPEGKPVAEKLGGMKA